MVINLTVQNSTCQVKNSTAELDKILSQQLSYKDQNIEFSIFKNRKRIKQINAILDSSSFASEGLDKELARLLRDTRWLEKQLLISLYQNKTFPTGLLPRFNSIMSELGHSVNVKDMRVKPRLKSCRFVLKQSLPPLRYYQKDASGSFMDSGRGIIVMPTGTGKTMTLAKMIWELGVPTLIITPSKAITDMMMDTMKGLFGKGKVTKLTTKSVKINKINIVNIQALIKIDPKVMKGIDAVFIDEFHHSAADTYREVNLKHLKDCYFRMGLTATNFRNDGSDIALESVLSEVLYEYEIKRAIEDGFLVKPEFFIMDNEVGPQEKTYQKDYTANIVENDNRNEIIADLAQELEEQGHSTIILVQRVEHGERLRDLIPGAKFIHGTEKDLIRQKTMEEFRKGKLKTIIGTSVIGEGVDLPIGDALIMAGGGKARSAIMQNIGRVLRIFAGKTKALVFDFQDRGSKWLESHSDQRQEVYTIYD